jgi:signal transduction histidine kinase
MIAALVRFARRLAAFCVVVAPALAAVAAPQVQVIEQAQLVLGEPGSAARAVALPFSWDKEVGARAGTARFHAEFALGDRHTPMALLLPRVGNSYDVRLNGQEIARFGTRGDEAWVDAVQQPRLVELPAALLVPVNSLEIGITASMARGAGLSPLLVGPRDELQARQEHVLLWQYSGSRLVAIVSAVLGLLALLLWLRRRDPLFLYYGAGELAWSVQTTRVLFDQAPLPWPWSGVLVTTAFHLAPPLICKFALAAVGRNRGVLWQGLTAMTWLALPAAVLWLVFGWLWIGPAWQTVSALAALAMAVIVVRATWRSTSWEERVLCVAVVAIVVAAVRDVALLRLSRHAFEVLPWTRFAWLGFAVAMAWVIAERMRKDSVQLATLAGTLQRELQAREAELAAALERERDNHKRSGALEERQRLVRDLHDGLGGHLVGTLRLAQQEGVPREALAHQLREAIDQLRITVDSMHDAEGDVAAALAAVRYRLAPRLQAAGIELDWQVEALPVAPHWGVREAHHLQMLLYEAFSNMIQHSGAARATLAARGDGGGLRISLSDNGTGFDTGHGAARGGKGLANMHKRAQALGAGFDLRSGPQGTVLELALPIRPGPES